MRECTTASRSRHGPGRSGVDEDVVCADERAAKSNKFKQEEIDDIALDTAEDCSRRGRPKSWQLVRSDYWSDGVATRGENRANTNG
jgi:hypothetical protein